MNLRDLLKKHEGVRAKLYTDTKGIPTIGCGRNAKDVGLSPDEIDLLLTNDIQRCYIQANRFFPWFYGLTQARQDVIMSMIFNMGAGAVCKFNDMIAAIQNQDWDKAADAMLNSHWHDDVGKRAEELAEMMRTGTYPDGS